MNLEGRDSSTMERSVVSHTNAAPDKGYSWVILLACFCFNMLTFGLYRCSGILYVHLIQDFGINRQQASWPFSVCVTTLLLSSPLPALLIQRFSIRCVCLIASCFLAVGNSACFFSNDIFMFTIFYGVVQGIGISAFAVLPQVICNQYFLKRRGIASSISFSGANFAAFIFAPFLEYLIEEYGLRGAMLVLGGTVLNCAVASCFLKPPPWKIQTAEMVVHKQKPASKQISANNIISTGECSEMRTLQNLLQHEDKVLSTDFNNHTSGVTNGDISSSNTCPKKRSVTLESKTMCNISLIQTQKEEVFQEKLPFLPSDITQEPRKLDKLRNGFKSTDWTICAKVRWFIREILLCPMFILITSSHAIYAWIFMTNIMFVADFLADRGMEKRGIVLVVSFLPLADLIGKIGSAWFADRKIVQRKHVAMLGLFLTGVSTSSVPIIQNHILLIISYMVFSFAIGCLIPLINVLLVEYLGLEKLPLAFSFSNFVCGILTLTRPPLVGYFRDNIGSYDGLLYFQGAIAFVVAMMWFLEPLFIRRSRI